APLLQVCDAECHISYLLHAPSHHLVCVGSLLLYRATPTTAIYPLSLHDALPISRQHGAGLHRQRESGDRDEPSGRHPLRQLDGGDRKSTRLNSSHEWISYAVFCLKKKTADDVASIATRAIPTQPHYTVQNPARHA